MNIKNIDFNQPVHIDGTMHRTLQDDKGHTFSLKTQFLVVDSARGNKYLIPLNNVSCIRIVE